MPTVTNTAGVLTNIGFWEQTENTFHKELYIKLKGNPMKFQGTTAGIASIEKGAIYLAFKGTQTAATTGWEIDYNMRFRYYDV